MKRKRVRETFESHLYWTYGRRFAIRALKNPLFQSGDRVRVTVELIRPRRKRP